MINHTRKESNEKIYASFYLGNTEFAIVVEKLSEVLNLPSEFIPIPLAPAYLKGAFNAQGRMIPVLDLRTIFEFEPTLDASKIAIIDYGKYHLGILFDRTGQIFRSVVNEESLYDNKVTTSSSKIIKGVFKKDQGKRMIQIIDVDEVFKLEHIPFEVPKEREGLPHSHIHRGNRQQCISFIAGESRCALNIDAIYEIVKVDELHTGVLSVQHCIGTIDLRGITVPIIDFVAFLGFRETNRASDATGGESRIIVMRLGEELFGLLVDAVESIVTYFEGDIIDFPVIMSKRSDMVSGCIIQHGVKDTLLLNHTNILSNDEIVAITRGHNKIYAVGADSRLPSSGLYKRHKQSFIMFTIECQFAVAIDMVSEIMAYPSFLLQPPGLPSHYKGVLNSRGELIPIIDTRAMYALPERTFEDCKVLVFKFNDIKYGLIVDSVDSIIHFSEQDKMPLPKLLHHQVNGLNEDVLEAVEITTANQENLNLFILNLEAITHRIAGVSC